MESGTVLLLGDVKMRRLRLYWSRNGILLICIFACAGFLLLLTPGNPLVKVSSRPVTAGSARVIIGPYPLANDLQRLADNGVRTVVSLLDSRIPYESILLFKERQLCRHYGQTLLNF